MPGLFLEDMTRNALWEGEGGVEFSGVKVNNLQYADDMIVISTTL